MPPLHSTLASGMLPTEHTKLATAINGPTSAFSTSRSHPGPPCRKSAFHHPGAPRPSGSPRSESRWRFLSRASANPRRRRPPRRPANGRPGGVPYCGRHRRDRGRGGHGDGQPSSSSFAAARLATRACSFQVPREEIMRASAHRAIRRARTRPTASASTKAPPHQDPEHRAEFDHEVGGREHERERWESAPPPAERAPGGGGGRVRTRTARRAEGRRPAPPSAGLVRPNKRRHLLLRTKHLQRRRHGEPERPVPRRFPTPSLSAW